MCELLGFTSAKRTDIRDFLRKFYAHSVQNPHGWGMMYEADGQHRIVKEAVSAAESRFLGDLIGSLPPQKTALAHIRFATVGSISERNCHPFTASDNSGRTWTLIHNGTIFNGKHLHRYAAEQQGDTDSERFFLYLIDTVNKQLAKSVPTERERFACISRFIAENAPRNKLNLMIWDGDLLYVHKNLEHTLSLLRLEDGILFATKPLDDGVWLPFPTAQVIAYKHGQEVYRGDRHNGTFVPTLEYITAMDAMHI